MEGRHRTRCVRDRRTESSISLKGFLRRPLTGICMRYLMIAALLIAGCGQTQSVAVPQAREGPHAKGSPASELPQWRTSFTDHGAELALATHAGNTQLQLSCPMGEGRLVVNVPGFKIVASEERLSIGQGTEALAMVATSTRSSARLGVSAESPVPQNLVALLAGPVSASYGAQVTGPHPPPAASQVQAFAVACRAGATDGSQLGASSSHAPPANKKIANACLTQDGRAIAANILRATGTEPFWAAKVEGRCVTYSHPDNPSGTRVWARFSGSFANGSWSGALNGKPFLLRTRPRAGCSDGMSDVSYPIAVSLTVGGQHRSGCASRR